MQQPKISYVCSKYSSFQRTADAYREIIRGKYELVEDATQAQIVIFHGPPLAFEQSYIAHPFLRKKYVIAYCVWEADELPDAYRKSITFANEIWTCSEYCYRIFAKCHPNVVRVPHVIERDTTCRDLDLTLVKRLVGFQPGLVYFLSVAWNWDKRKNVDTLLKAFENSAPVMPQARLILKLRPNDPLPPVCDKRVLLLPVLLTDGAINALYQLSAAYISAHHSEGWGLTLSDAMIFRRPVVATGYSGNLDFMNSDNSFLLKFEESNIRLEDCAFYFDPRMRWAYPDQADLEEKLLFLYENMNSAAVTDRVQRAGQDIRRFDRDAVAGILLERIGQITQSMLYQPA